MASQWLTIEDFQNDLINYSEGPQVDDSFGQCEPKTITEWRAQMEANKKGSIFDNEEESDEEGVTYILPGTGRGVTSVVYRPGDRVRSSENDDMELRNKIRAVSGLGYSNELIKEQYQAEVARRKKEQQEREERESEQIEKEETEKKEKAETPNTSPFKLKSTSMTTGIEPNIYRMSPSYYLPNGGPRRESPSSVTSTETEQEEKEKRQTPPPLSAMLKAGKPKKKLTENASAENKVTTPVDQQSVNGREQPLKSAESSDSEVISIPQLKQYIKHLKPVSNFANIENGTGECTSNASSSKKRVESSDSDTGSSNSVHSKTHKKRSKKFTQLNLKELTLEEKVNIEGKYKHYGVGIYRPGRGLDFNSHSEFPPLA